MPTPKEAITLHQAHGNPNNRTSLLNLEAKGIQHKNLTRKRYILAVSCDARRVATIIKRDNKTSTATLTKHCQTETG